MIGPSLAFGQGGPLKKATFLPQWKPQAQFAGYYMAKEKGFYKRNGIDLTILQGGPDRHASVYLTKDRTDFATLWLSTALRMQESGQPIVNVAQIIQRSALMLVAKKSSQIRRPEDLNGKKVSLWGDDFQIQPKAFFKKYQIHVRVIPQSFSINLFLRGGVDVASAMWYNEYHTLLNSGLDPEDLITFLFHEHGLNFPEDGIYTLKENFKKDPALSCSFARASLEGWLYAFSHTEETLDIVVRQMLQAKIPVDRIHQKWMLTRMKELILPGGTPTAMGVLQPTDYDRVAQELKRAGLIRRSSDLNHFFVRCVEDVSK
ncbi:MAG: ABC transporter substrate-binding protein [Syntrophaceae bacterium]|nr:ABC transporter substrate-binding protein [Syntrophaceae bacterium]